MDVGLRDGSRWHPVQVEYSNDSLLVDALRRGDESAFSWLLDTYHRPLHRTAVSFVGSGATADEVVQETWLAVITGIDRFEGRSSLKTWIYRILMNIARTRGAREARSVPFSSAGPDTEGSSGDEPAFSPDRFSQRGRWAGHWTAPPEPWDELSDDRLLAEETLGLVRAAIEQLPERQRVVITLRDLDGLSAAEVCDLLDLTEANQRVLLHRARARVRDALEDHLMGADR
jgi:RNA polymerase sigma-70 factor (ECF subfamily)